jgi:hypothetical protein
MYRNRILQLEMGSRNLRANEKGGRMSWFENVAVSCHGKFMGVESALCGIRDSIISTRRLKAVVARSRSVFV